MMLKEVISENVVCSALKATTKKEAFVEMASMLAESGCIKNLDTFMKDLFEREAIEVTTVGNDIALPHAKSNEVLQCKIAVGRKLEGIYFGDEDGENVRLIFMFAACENSVEHLPLLAKFACMLCNEDFTEELLQAKNEKEMLETIWKYEEICEENK